MDDERTRFHDPDVELGEITIPAPLLMDGPPQGPEPPPPPPPPPPQNDEPGGRRRK